MEKSSRWIAITADMVEHPLFADSPERLYAWVWLLSKAAWKEHPIKLDGKLHTISRGEVVVGREFLARTWNWSGKRVRTFLGQLEDAGMIKMGPTQGRMPTVATICNYGKYQDIRENDQLPGASMGPARGQHEGQQKASTGPAKGHTVPGIPVINKNDFACEGATTDQLSGVAPASVPDCHSINESARRSPTTTASTNPTAHANPVVSAKPAVAAPSRNPRHLLAPLAPEPVWIENGRIVADAETRAEWLEPAMFGGDTAALDLALIAAAGWVQTNSSKSVKVQVSAQLAQTCLKRRDQAKRYEAAKAQGTAASTKPVAASFADQERQRLKKMYQTMVR